MFGAKYAISERHVCRLPGQWHATQRYTPTACNDEDALARAIVALRIGCDVLAFVPDAMPMPYVVLRYPSKAVYHRLHPGILFH